MVEQVVGNIIEAEDKAEQIKAAGKEEAKIILSNAQKSSLERRAACLKECRALAEEGKKIAAQKAEDAYREVLTQGKAQAAEVAVAYGKNTEKAVQAVVEAIVG